MVVGRVQLTVMAVEVLDITRIFLHSFGGARKMRNIHGMT